MGTYNTIVLKQGQAQRVQWEKLANAADIYPGMLLELMSTDKVKPHANAAQDVAIPVVALEDALQGNGINDLYASGAIVTCWIPQRGDEAWMVLADGENVAIGDELESNGAGYLQKYVADIDAAHSDSEADAATTIYTRPVVAMALEALDLSDSSGGEESSDPFGYNHRIKVVIV